MVLSTEDRVALVTGAGRGIGREIARRLATEGFDVVVNYRADEASAEQTCAMIREGGGTAWPVQANVSLPADVKRMFAHMRGLASRLDVLVNSAGAVHEALFMLTPPKTFEDILLANVLGAVHCSHAALPIMLRQRAGNIVNISSTAARGSAGLSAYGAGKAALESLTRSLAREVARMGIRVNAVAPSWTATDMLSSANPGEDSKFAERTAAGRVAHPAEIASVVAALVRNDMTYVSGQVLGVDGGGLH
jgi:3-oxoacyl-[acyl-carrier protein] reductase